LKKILEKKFKKKKENILKQIHLIIVKNISIFSKKNFFFSALDLIAKLPSEEIK
jgi:hypothetical protein